MRVYTTKSLRTLYYCVRCIKMFSTIVVKYMLVSPKCLIINSSTLGCAMEYEVSLFLSLRGYPCRHIYIYIYMHGENHKSDSPKKDLHFQKGIITFVYLVCEKLKIYFHFCLTFLLFVYNKWEGGIQNSGFPC